QHADRPHRMADAAPARHSLRRPRPHRDRSPLPARQRPRGDGSRAQIPRRSVRLGTGLSRPRWREANVRVLLRSRRSSARADGALLKPTSPVTTTCLALESRSVVSRAEVRTMRHGNEALLGSAIAMFLLLASSSAGAGDLAGVPTGAA